MPVTFLTTDDGERLLNQIEKLNKQADVLHSAVRDLTYYIHQELNPLVAKLEKQLAQTNRKQKTKKG